MCRFRISVEHTTFVCEVCGALVSGAPGYRQLHADACETHEETATEEPTTQHRVFAGAGPADVKRLVYAVESLLGARGLLVASGSVAAQLAELKEREQQAKELLDELSRRRLWSWS